MKAPWAGDYRKAPLLMALTASLIAGCSTLPNCPDDKPRAGEGHLPVPRNEHVVLGLLPRYGGRAVVLRRPSGENVFRTDPAFWRADAFVGDDLFIKRPPIQRSRYFD